MKALKNAREQVQMHSIEELAMLLLHTDKSALKLDKVLSLAVKPADLVERHPLHVKMEAIVHQLEVTKKTVINSIPVSALNNEEEKTRLPIEIAEQEARKELINTSEKSALVCEKTKLENDIREMKSKMDETNRLMGEMMRLFQSQHPAQAQAQASKTAGMN